MITASYLSGQQVVHLHSNRAMTAPSTALKHFHLWRNPEMPRRPYNLYCVGGDVKPCSINQSTQKCNSLRGHLFNLLTFHPFVCLPPGRFGPKTFRVLVCGF